MWNHDFICLARNDQDTPPSPMERAKLMQAGLGLKKLTFFEDIDNESFHQELLEAFPNLSEAGGFELLRTSERSNKFLDVIPLPSSGYSIQYLKSIAAQAKIYIRPIQQDLKVEVIQEDGVKV